ncbi:hypothetical protein CQW23_25482 [Capsicum baccatum]|uniref:NB-ARC domain-containing protein n=1 Tax=Capsicum baccatum TaxID=33114 RepID=A0A2G2VL34_CAPBA|nr:hypothetical protein CQW23_25482 [Capsicum baccatum]
MTEVAVNSLLEKLLELGRENTELIVGVKDDVNDLVADLQILKAFLKDASKIDGDNQGWKQSLKEIRNVVYKADDSVDKFLVEAKEHQDTYPAAKWIDVPYWINVKNVAKEIQAIKNKVKDLQVKYKPLLETDTQLSTLSMTSPQPIQINLSDEDDVVGLEKEANTVIDRLIHGSEKLEVVPIVSMAGLGKSTLARKVYRDSRITFEFVSCIWVNVSRSYNKTKVLLNILKHLRKQLDMNKSDDQMIREIRTFLGHGRRCLIVVDDVWSTDIIEFIKHVFPNNKKGHRIMMTSRFEEVGSCFNHDCHKLTFLTDEESWFLLNLKVFGKRYCPSELEETGRNIAKKCNGLPLSVLVTAGVLAGRTTKREWQLVYENMGDCLIYSNDPRTYVGLIKMSYDLLSYYQQACFLYCASFPQSFNIPAWKLIHLWIAEGFIPIQKQFTLEEQAEECLNDLTKKNLLMVIEQSLDGKIKTCRLNDMFYEFCEKEAIEEDIVCAIKNAPDQESLETKDLGTCRRLCIDSSTLSNFLKELRKKPPMENVKSFLCFSSKPIDNQTPNMNKSLHKGFPLIKVLDVEPIRSLFSKDFYRLLHLKYISLSGEFKALPLMFVKFWNLETLIIHTTHKVRTFEVKADIWSMMRLRHLHVNVPTKLPPSSASISKERECNIHTLSVIAPQSCTSEVFTRARNLRKLAIRGQVFSLFDNNASGLSGLDMLKRLEKLKIVNDDPNLEKLKMVNDDQDLEKSKIVYDDQDDSQVMIPPVMVFMLPNTLRKLTLYNTRLNWRDMTKLGPLESLEVLKLRQNAFSGEFWEPEIGSFARLEVLWIEKTDLQIWKASSHNFPRLKQLVLILCEELEEVPQGLADIPNLQEIRLECTYKAVKSASIIAKKKMEDHASSSVSRFRLSVFPPHLDADDSS